MINIKNRIIIIFLILFLSLSKLSLADLELNVKLISQTLKLIETEYIEKVDTNLLLNGAIDGLNTLLKENKIKTDLPPLPKNIDFNTNIQNFKNRFEKIVNQYGGKFTQNTLIYASLKGMMFILNKPPYNDPYSVALEPKEYKILHEQMSGGNFGGIGVFIQLDKKNNNQLTVVEPIEETPAYIAGLRSGDQILKINAESTKGMDLDVAVKKIRGKIGTEVNLNIRRKNEIARDFILKRQFIHVKSAVPKLLNKKIGYIKLRVFGQDTNAEFKDALKKLIKKNAQGIILDLRNNGGGYITSAVDICSKFLPRGSLVVQVVNYRSGQKEPYRSYEFKSIKLPLVVLINNFSASASEIVAGAVQDTKIGILIGEKTYGKGSVQTIYEFQDGGALKYTIAHYLTPQGRDINKKGIMPDIEIKTDPNLIGTSQDLQLKKAFQYLEKKAGGKINFKFLNSFSNFENLKLKMA
ncbi:MAG: S41 family peptidase [Armatimonadetes bacterium]|nr:S41 family peptidase [Armatimonadota bacterium]